MKSGVCPEARRAPQIWIEGFSGPLDDLLELARTDGIDLSRLPLLDVLDQFIAALRRPERLAEKAGWLVIAARLVELRSRLLLPRDSAEQREAEADAATLRGQLVELQVVRALADWLEARPRLGRDVFARGQPASRQASEDALEIDFIEFLWASVAVFEGFGLDAGPVYRPRPPDLHPIAGARTRIFRLLADAPAGLSLAELIPAPAADSVESLVRRRSAWTSTFVPGLDLARQGTVALEQASRDAAVLMQLRHGVIDAAAA